MTTMSENPVPNADEGPDAGRPTPRVLVAVDDSDGSARAAAFVNRFFGGWDVEILAVNVAPVPLAAGTTGAGFGGWYAWPMAPVLTEPMYQETLAAAHEQSAEAAERSGVAGAEPSPAVGDPVTAILEVAQERDVDLIVVGSGHHGLLDRMLRGSTSRQIVRDADRPVLVVP